MKKKNNKYDNALIIIVLSLIALGFYVPAQSWEYSAPKCNQTQSTCK